MTTPVSSQGKSSMITVKGAINALRRACFSTIAGKLRPLRRAVRIYCAFITSIIEARVMRGGDRQNRQHPVGARPLAHARHDTDQKHDRDHNDHHPEHEDPRRLQRTCRTYSVASALTSHLSSSAGSKVNWRV